MMNNQTIKQELLQYTARLIESSPLQNNTNKDAARHDVAALLTEQALELSMETDDSRNLFIAKPLLKANLILIRERVNTIGELANYSYELAQLKKEYLQTISTLEKILDNLSD